MKSEALNLDRAGILFAYFETKKDTESSDMILRLSAQPILTLRVAIMVLVKQLHDPRCSHEHERSLQRFVDYLVHEELDEESSP